MNTCTRRTEFAKQPTVALALWVSIYISKGLLKSTSEYGTKNGFGWPSGCNQLQLYINIQPSKRNIPFLQTYYIIRDLTHDWDVKVKTGLHTTVADKIMERIVTRKLFFWVSDEV